MKNIIEKFYYLEILIFKPSTSYARVLVKIYLINFYVHRY